MPFERWPGTEDSNVCAASTANVVRYTLDRWTIRWDHIKRISLAHLSWTIYKSIGAQQRFNQEHYIQTPRHQNPLDLSPLHGLDQMETETELQPNNITKEGCLISSHSFLRGHRRPPQDGKVNCGPVYIHNLQVLSCPWHFNNAPNFTSNVPLTTIKLLWWKPKSDTDAWATSIYFI